MWLQTVYNTMRRCSKRQAGDHRVHARPDRLSVAEGKHDVRPPGRATTRCDPVLRFTDRPIRNSAAKTRPAHVDDH